MLTERANTIRDIMESLDKEWEQINEQRQELLIQFPTLDLRPLWISSKDYFANVYAVGNTRADVAAEPANPAPPPQL